MEAALAFPGLLELRAVTVARVASVVRVVRRVPAAV
jgi:hypothetical protein